VAEGVQRQSCSWKSARPPHQRRCDYPKGQRVRRGPQPDFLLTNDKWSIPLAIKSGPDGNVYLLDWYDKQICHTTNPEVWDRTNGRIYKISHKDAKPVKPFDLSKATWRNS